MKPAQEIRDALVPMLAALPTALLAYGGPVVASVHTYLDLAIAYPEQSAAMVAAARETILKSPTAAAMAEQLLAAFDE